LKNQDPIYVMIECVRLFVGIK